MKTKSLLHWSFGLGGVSLVLYSVLGMFSQRYGVTPWIGMVGLLLTIFGLIGVYSTYSQKNELLALAGCGLGIVGSTFLVAPALAGSGLPLWAVVIYCLGFVVLGCLQLMGQSFVRWAGILLLLGSLGIVLFSYLSLGILLTALAGLVLGLGVCWVAYTAIMLDGAPQVQPSA